MNVLPKRPYIELNIQTGVTKKNVIQLNYNETSQHGQTISPFDAIYDHKLEWNYIITIRNNSSEPAYNVKLIDNKGVFSQYPKIEESYQIGANFELEIPLRIERNFTGKGKNANAIIELKFPDDLHEIEITTNYHGESRLVNYESVFKYHKNGSQTNTHKKNYRYWIYLVITIIGLIILNWSTLIGAISDTLTVKDNLVTKSETLKVEYGGYQGMRIMQNLPCFDYFVKQEIIINNKINKDQILLHVERFNSEIIDKTGYRTKDGDITFLFVSKMDYGLDTLDCNDYYTYNPFEYYESVENYKDLELPFRFIWPHQSLVKANQQEKYYLYFICHPTDCQSLNYFIKLNLSISSNMGTFNSENIYFMENFSGAGGKW